MAHDFIKVVTIQHQRSVRKYILYFIYLFMVVRSGQTLGAQEVQHHEG